MNAIILYATAIILKIKPKTIRIILASAIGSVYAIITYITEIPIYTSIISKGILSIVMVYVGFNPQNMKKMWKQVLIFYLTSFVFGGVALYLIYFIKPQNALIKNGMFVGEYALKVVFLGAIVAFVIIKISIKIIEDVKIYYGMTLEYKDNKKLTFNETINLLKGDSLPVSSFLDKKSGIFEGGTTKDEKRNIAENIPEWIKENCIECNQCAFSCPHGVIRPFLLDKKDDKIESIPSLMPKDKEFTIGINYEACTGCGVCVETCPGKLGNKALKMVPNKRHDEDFDYLLKHNCNNQNESKLLNVKNISFKEPKFEYSGACAGCGETPYITNLTRVFGNNLIISNATGCSSIYGGSVPSTPYTIPWASSLFEDNTEYGYGILQGINIKRNKIKKYMEEYPRNKIFKKWLENMDNYVICKEIKQNIDYKKHPYLNDMKDYIIEEAYKSAFRDDDSR